MVPGQFENPPMYEKITAVTVSQKDQGLGDGYRCPPAEHFIRAG
jgi:hypothetical protein